MEGSMLRSAPISVSAFDFPELNLPRPLTLSSGQHSTFLGVHGLAAWKSAEVFTEFDAANGKDKLQEVPVDTLERVGLTMELLQRTLSRVFYAPGHMQEGFLLIICNGKGDAITQMRLHSEGAGKITMPGESGIARDEKQLYHSAPAKPKVAVRGPDVEVPVPNQKLKDKRMRMPKRPRDSEKVPAFPSDAELPSVQGPGVVQAESSEGQEPMVPLAYLTLANLHNWVTNLLTDHPASLAFPFTWWNDEGNDAITDAVADKLQSEGYLSLPATEHGVYFFHETALGHDDSAPISKTNPATSDLMHNLPLTGNQPVNTPAPTTGHAGAASSTSPFSPASSAPGSPLSIPGSQPQPTVAGLSVGGTPSCLCKSCTDADNATSTGKYSYSPLAAVTFGHACEVLEVKAENITDATLLRSAATSKVSFMLRARRRDNKLCLMLEEIRGSYECDTSVFLTAVSLTFRARYLTGAQQACPVGKAPVSLSNSLHLNGEGQTSSKLRPILGGTAQRDFDIEQTRWQMAFHLGGPVSITPAGAVSVNIGSMDSTREHLSRPLYKKGDELVIAACSLNNTVVGMGTGFELQRDLYATLVTGSISCNSLAFSGQPKDPILLAGDVLGGAGVYVDVECTAAVLHIWRPPRNLSINDVMKFPRKGNEFPVQLASDDFPFRFCVHPVLRRGP